jgi:hypothetical protein
MTAVGQASGLSSLSPVRRRGWTPAHGTLAERPAIAGIAPLDCRRCHGYGMRWGRQDGANCDVVCECVWRSIFRQCLERARAGLMFPCECGPVGVEYAADVALTARRELSEPDYRIFQLRLEGLDQAACSRLLRMREGDYWHALYRIQERLGKVFAELEPYPLYPDYAYFGGWRREIVRPDREVMAQVGASTKHKQRGIGYVFKSTRIW